MVVWIGVKEFLYKRNVGETLFLGQFWFSSDTVLVFQKSFGI